jgi:hypothetical protein
MVYPVMTFKYIKMMHPEKNATNPHGPVVLVHFSLQFGKPGKLLSC